MYPKWQTVMENIDEKFDFLQRVDRVNTVSQFRIRFEEVKEYPVVMAACAMDPEYWTDNKVQEDVDVVAALDIVAKRLLTETQELQFMQEMNAYLSKQVGYSWAENER